MSKTRERAQKVCLNCNTELYDRYCHKCGQENIEPKHSVWHLVTHFFYDITHFDGKFFGTLKYLVKKPGFLSSEYIKGRRNSYLNPIRMYVFTSALFFLIFFSMFTIKDEAIKPPELKFDNKVIDQMKTQAYKGAETKEDSVLIDSALKAFGNAVTPKKEANEKIDSNSNKIDSNRNKKPKRKLTNKSGFNISGWTSDDSMTVARYDSIQNSLPSGKKDNWLSRKINRQMLVLEDRYENNSGKLLADLLNKFFHTFPYLLFISLPLYALYLKLLYVRRKQFWYVDHGIFLIHLYIYTFLLLLVIFLLQKIKDSYSLEWITFIQVVLSLYGIYYAFRSMRNFYKQGWFKTFLKFSVLNFLAFVSLTILFVVFFILSVFQL